MTNKQEINDAIFTIVLEKYSPFIKYLLTFEERVSAFLKEYSRMMAVYGKRAVAGGYKKSKEPQAKEISDNLNIYQIKNSKSKLKKIFNANSKYFEEYGNVLAFKFKKKKLSDLKSRKNVIVKFKPNSRRKAKNLNKIDLFLVRYSPWVPKLLPYIPRTDGLIVLFVNVTEEEFKTTHEKNNKIIPKFLTLLKANKINPKGKKYVSKNLEGYEDLEYWILRKEFGINTRILPVWKDMANFMVTKGWLRILNNNPEIKKTLIDYEFKDYKKFLKDDKIISEKDLSTDFAKRIFK